MAPTTHELTLASIGDLFTDTLRPIHDSKDSLQTQLGSFEEKVNNALNIEIRVDKLEANHVVLETQISELMKELNELK